MFRQPEGEDQDDEDEDDDFSEIMHRFKCFEEMVVLIDGVVIYL